MAARTKRIWAIGACATFAALFLVSWNGFTLPVWLAEISSGQVLSHAGGASAEVALTFDDGPDPTYTPRILEVLNRYNVKATFFVVGRQLRKYPAIARSETVAGNVLGNHTDTHPYIDRLPPAALRRELDACDAALASSAGIRTYLFRPPRGAWNPRIYHEAARRGQRIILWSVALEHEATPQPRQMADRVLSQIRPGGVILMHDGANVSRETTVQALPLLLDGLRAKGYRCVTVPEMFGIKDDTVEDANTHLRSEQQP